MTIKNNKTVTITLIRSTIGVKKSHKDTVRGLGLRKINSISTLNDTAEVRGMIRKIDYLLKYN